MLFQPCVTYIVPLVPCSSLGEWWYSTRSPCLRKGHWVRSLLGLRVLLTRCSPVFCNPCLRHWRWREGLQSWTLRRPVDFNISRRRMVQGLIATRCVVTGSRRAIKLSILTGQGMVSPSILLFGVVWGLGDNP